MELINKIIHYKQVEIQIVTYQTLLRTRINALYFYYHYY